MNLIVENQVTPGVYRHLDYVCDLCHKRSELDELVAVYINKNSTFSNQAARQQLVACRSCMGKLASTIHGYLGNVLVGIPEQPEVIEL